MEVGNISLSNYRIELILFNKNDSMDLLASPIYSNKTWKFSKIDVLTHDFIRHILKNQFMTMPNNWNNTIIDCETDSEDGFWYIRDTLFNIVTNKRNAVYSDVIRIHIFASGSMYEKLSSLE